MALRAFTAKCSHEKCPINDDLDAVAQRWTNGETPASHDCALNVALGRDDTVTYTEVAVACPGCGGPLHESDEEDGEYPCNTCKTTWGLCSSCGETLTQDGLTCNGCECFGY